MKDIVIPLTVPLHLHEQFVHNYQTICKNSDHLFLFTVDHKIEHLNPISPEHLFAIGRTKEIGAMALPFGLFTRYARAFPTIPYLIKLNSKTNIQSNYQQAYSCMLTDIETIVTCQKQNAHLKICGVGITVYIGNQYESAMFEACAHAITKAHKYGLVTVVWLYPRITNVAYTLSTPSLLAGCTSIANSLGADFVKIKPHPPIKQWAGLALQSAGNTKILCAGMEKISPALLLQTIQTYLDMGITGVAIGRNLFERPFDEAVDLVQSIGKLIY